MATTIKYIGTADNYAELPVTGKQSVWQVGQQEERSDVEAGQLLATGLFSSAPLPVMASTNLTGGIELVGVQLPRRTTPLRVATFGDSTAAAGAVNSAGGPDVSAVIAANWATGTTELNIAGDKWQVPSLYPQAFLVAAGGIGGATTAGMPTRDVTADAGAAFSTQAILNLALDVVLFRGGSINDYIGASPIGISAGISQHQRLISRFLAAGVPVVDCGMYGYNGTPGSLTNAQVQAIIVEFNRQCAEFAKQYPGRVAFANCAALVGDGSGGYASNMSIDGTHLSWPGQRQAARAEASALESLFGKSSGTRYSGLNIVSNSMFANPNPLINSPTGFAVGVSNGTRQNYKIETIDGKSFFTVEILITAANSYADIYIPYDPSAMGIVAGDMWGFECDYYIAGVDGLVLTNVLAAFTVETKHASGGLVKHGCIPAATGFVLTEPVIGHATFQPIKYGDSSANFTAAGSPWHFKVTVANPSGVYKVGIACPRAVKLT